MSLPKVMAKRLFCPKCLALFRTEFARCPTDGTALETFKGDPLLGRTLANRYVLEECVGEGGMGRVYRARHTRVSRRFAVKILFGDLSADARMRARFVQEGEAASRLSHPNVVSVVDVGETPEGQLYLVMDYVEGPSLHHLISEQAPLESDRAANLLRQLASGLGHAHQQGLVHRDFKPGNVIIAKGDEGEMPKILDFGLARLVDLGFDASLTTEGQVMGTPAYMSPEHATGGAIDRRLDLFSLGVVLYEMLSGKHPFSGSKAEIVQQNIAVPPPAIAVRVPGLVVDSRLEAMATKLMAKNPDDRYQNGKEILEAIADHPTLRPEVRQRARSLASVVPSDSLFVAATRETMLEPRRRVPSSSAQTVVRQLPMLDPSLGGLTNLDQPALPAWVDAKTIPSPPPEIDDSDAPATRPESDAGAALAPRPGSDAGAALAPRAGSDDGTAMASRSAFDLITTPAPPPAFDHVATPVPPPAFDAATKPVPPPAFDVDTKPSPPPEIDNATTEEHVAQSSASFGHLSTQLVTMRAAESSGKLRWPVILAVVVVLVAAGGVAAWFMMGA